MDFFIVSEDFNIVRGNFNTLRGLLQILVVTANVDKATKVAGGVAVSCFGFKFSLSANLVFKPPILALNFPVWQFLECHLFSVPVVNMQLSVKEGQLKT